MNKYAIAAIIVTLAQIAFAGAGLYCLYRAMRGVRAISASDCVAHAWNAWFKQALWCLGMGLFLMLSVVLSFSLRQSWVVVIFVTLAFLVLGGLQLAFFLRRNRLADAGGMPQVASGEVIVKQLKPNRVRGLDDNGEPLYFTEADLADFKGLRGHVRMLANSIAMGYRAGGLMPPLMSFQNERGASFVIYQDDVVELAKK